MGSPVVVEMVGLPGAGKTSVAAEVAVQFEAGRVLTCQEEPGLLDWRKAGISVVPNSRREWRTLATALKLCVSARPIRMDRFKVLGPLPSSRRRAVEVFTQKRSEIVLFDEWVLQRIWSIVAFSERFGSDSLSKLVRCVSEDIRPMVVVLHADPRVAVDRIVHRNCNHSRFDRLPKDEAFRWLDKATRVIREISDTAKRCGCPVLELSAERSVSENAKAICAFAGIKPDHQRT